MNTECLHYHDSPDWQSFRQHIDRIIRPARSDYARLVNEYALFACLPDAARTQLLQKVEFDHIDHIPGCIKYKRPSSVTFIDADRNTYGIALTSISVDLSTLISLDSDHFLDLHPVRYDKVKEAISLGEIDMPIVRMRDEGYPEVSDGRHRAVALIKYGITTIEILVPRDEKQLILSYLNQHSN
jgi:hypothetical protein